MDGVLVQAHKQREAPSLPPVRPPTPLEAGISDRDFQRVQSLIRRQAGIVLSAQKRDMVSRRLGKRLRTLGLQDLGAYMDRVEGGDQAELQEFRNALTTNLTAFFREPHHFQVLKDYFASHGRGHTYRVWSAACSTGEEPYSIAMSAMEHFGSLHPPVRILATDLDTNVLAHARDGIYAEERIESLGQERKRAFFLRGQGEFEGKVRVQAPLKS
ncbi:MAG: CheR family methyltransferase, partial [Oceanococcaceae bacterium]